MMRFGLTFSRRSVHPSLRVLWFLFGCAPPAPPPAEPAVPPADQVEPQAPDALELRRKALSTEVRELVTELEAAGRYDCCVQHSCKLCAMRAGGCRCGEAARAGEPVCEECAEMWMRGQGAESVDPKSIHSFLEAERRMRGDYGEICGEKPAEPTR